MSKEINEYYTLYKARIDGTDGSKQYKTKTGDDEKVSKENDKIFRTLEHIAITFDKLGYSPTIPIFKGHQDFEWLFKLELDTIKALCNQQDQKIADLEAKLAESEEKCFDLQQRLTDREEQCRECKHINKKIELNIKNKLMIENSQYEQQLAEKEKEIENLTTKLEEANHERHEEWKTGKEWKWEWQKTNRLLEQANQDKTDFAIEKLEKVKEFITDKLEFMWNNNAEMTCKDRNIIDKIYEELDQQIKELKHEDKGE